MLGEHDVAVLKVEEATRLNPNDAMARYFLGSVLRRRARLSPNPRTMTFAIFAAVPSTLGRRQEARRRSGFQFASGLAVSRRDRPDAARR